MNPVPSINFQTTLRTGSLIANRAALGKPTVWKLIDFTREKRKGQK